MSLSREIMLVEDNAVDMMFIEKALKDSNCADQVHSFTSGESALDFLRSIESRSGLGASPLPRLIILDIKLPGMSGFEVIQALRSNAKYRDIAIVVFSGSGSDHEKKMALDLGANSYFEKPFNITVFARSIDEIAKYWLRIPHRSILEFPLRSVLTRR